MVHLKGKIEEAWNNRELLKSEGTQKTIREVIELLDKGKLRVAEPDGDNWKVNEWVKKAVIRRHMVGLFDKKNKDNDKKKLQDGK